MATDSTRRFSNRVEDYVRYRPHYPAAVVTYLAQRYQLSPPQRVADIGAGTGISSSLFLDAGYPVAAVEPNREMREKALGLLGARPGFEVVNGTAEHTQLPDHSVDLIVAGQAFHWFDAPAAKREFVRILKPGGIVALLWNERLTGSAFERDYEALIREHGRDYERVDHRNIGPEPIAAFFYPHACEYQDFPNRQVFDLEGLLGRLLSSSYMPAREEPGYPEMAAALRTLFDRYQENGRIIIHYDTRVYSGRW
jgi:SAM-dependent methyltransferase